MLFKAREKGFRSLSRNEVMGYRASYMGIIWGRFSCPPCSLIIILLCARFLLHKLHSFILPCTTVSNAIASLVCTTDPILDAYHRMTLQLASDYGVKLLDTYSIANPLRDLTYDRCHYKGIVGWTLASYVVQSICSL